MMLFRMLILEQGTSYERTFDIQLDRIYSSQQKTKPCNDAKNCIGRERVF